LGLTKENKMFLSKVSSFLTIFFIFTTSVYTTEILPNTELQHTDADFDPTEELELLDQKIEDFLQNPPINESKQRSSTRSSTTKIMLLGDSITYDESIANDRPNARPASQRHGYRNYLYYKLKDANYNFNFVGSRSAGSAIRPSFDTDNEGYPGIKSNELASRIYNLLKMNTPDIILLHIGTNDTRDSSSISGLKNLLNEIDRFESNYNHHIKILLAKIIRSKDSSRNATIVDFNSNLVNLVNSRNDDIKIVNMYSGAGISNGDMADYLHPTYGGYSKMASKWFSSVRPYLGVNTQKPNAPSNLHVSPLTHNYAKLKWTDNSSNESGFKIYRDNIYIATTSANIREYRLFDLTAETHYNFYVKAYNSDGLSNSSGTSFTTKPEPIPQKPTHATTASITDKSVTLKWSDTSNNETGFRIYNGSKLIATLGANKTSYTLTKLVTRTNYTFTIKAYNKSGESSSIYVSFKTKDDYGWIPAINHTILF
jgi:lysophospholipase L1-like esterase